MTYNERITLCEKLLKDFRDMLPEGDARDDISITIEAIEDYTKSMAFLENRDEDKTTDSWNILLNTINRCHDNLPVLSEKLFPSPPKFVTKKEALSKLMEEYANCVSNGTELVPSMNINEWIEANGYVIVEDDDERLSSSSGEDDDSDNPKKLF